MSYLSLALALAAVGTLLAWIVTAWVPLHNLVALSLCVLMLSVVRLPSLRVASLLLATLFVYDVFWVFYSSRVFGDNVMLSVASQQAHNPLSSIGTPCDFASSLIYSVTVSSLIYYLAICALP